jgi:serine/threonine protein kinase/TolB-like protein
MAMVRPSEEFTAPDRGDGAATVPDPDQLPDHPTPAQLAAIVSAIGLPTRFEVIGLLGRGGMGIVLEARDARLGREVALKVLSQAKKYDHNARARFEREARAAAQLADPAIVTVYELADSGDYMVMELIRGETLRDRLARVGSLPLDEVRRLGRALCRALSVAHAAGVIHRDVKPSNVLYEEPSGRILLADFGIAFTRSDAGLTDTGMTMGTPAYMAPEQLRGANVDARADLYCVGVTLFEAAIGERLNGADGPYPDPFTAVRLATGDEPLAHAIARVTSLQVSARHASADELCDALVRLTSTAIGVAPVRAAPEAVTGAFRDRVAFEPTAENPLDPALVPTEAASVALEPTLPMPVTPPPPLPRTPVPTERPPQPAPSSPVAAAAPAPRPANKHKRLSPPRSRIAWRRVTLALVLVFALAGGITYLFLRRAQHAVVDVTAPPRMIAVLPFENRSTDPALAYAQHGLAKVLQDELTKQTALEHVERQAFSGNDPAAWLAQAHARHATHVVRGSLVDHAGGRLQLRLEIIRGRDGRSTVLERIASPAEVANTLRATVPAFAGALLEPADIASHLERGRLALVEDRVSDAYKHFATVLFHDPDNLDALYERAIATWWNYGTPEPTIVALEEALAKPLPAPQREVLVAYRKLVDMEFPGAITAFAELATRRPREFHILYGLFESQYHGGEPADSMQTFNRLRTLEPRIHIGLLHVLGHAVASPDTPGLEWARAMIGKDRRTRPLLARKLVADRDYRAATDLLATVDAGMTEEAASIEFTIVRIHLALVTDRFDDAAAAAARITLPITRLTYQLALAFARGDSAALSALLTDDKLAVIDTAVDIAGQVEIAELVPIAIALEHEPLLARVRAALDRQAGWSRRIVPNTFARALAGDTAETPYVEVSSLRRALAAEREARWADAIVAWREAARRSLQGRTLSIAQFGIARALHRSGDHRGAAVACGEVLEPRYLQAHWAVTAGDCLVWRIEDAVERNDRATAKTLADRLAKLRAAGGANDPVRARAAALLR